MLRVERAPDRLREHGAERVHVEHASNAAVRAAAGEKGLVAQVARPFNFKGCATGNAAQRERVPRVGEEGDRLLEVGGAGLVDVEVAVIAAVSDEAGELGSAYVASVGGHAVVVRPHKIMLWMGEVSWLMIRHVNVFHSLVVLRRSAWTFEVKSSFEDTYILIE